MRPENIRELAEIIKAKTGVDDIAARRQARKLLGRFIREVSREMRGVKPRRGTRPVTQRT